MKTLLIAGCSVWALASFAGPGEYGKIFDRLLYGTQYYRAPTPVAEEWEKDLEALGDYNLETIQIRINWRNNERAEDVYTFDDVDRLMDLAEKYNKRVVIKFLLECAPQYVFERYGGTRIGPKGEKIHGASHGAFYTGGWLPCFTNPKVAERMAKFVRVVAERYAGRKNLIFWNAWNEPRHKPVEECFCPECRKAFAAHMKARFGTIKALNDFYGVAEESFETLALPAMPHGYWDIFEFKLFKSSTCIYNNLKTVYDAVRTVDKVRPIISHIGFTSGFQNGLGDLSDDFTVSKSVDGWGTSLPMATKMANRGNRLEFGRLNQFLYSVSPNYFIYEIYPGLGMFRGEYDDEWDMDYKLYDGLAHGSKGFFFWQYRSERVGMENDCAGLARMDGSPRPVLNSVRDFGAVTKEFNEEILDYYPDNAEVAILFDYRSQLMSEVEDACGKLYEFADRADALRYYSESHKRFYHQMRLNDLRVDYLGTAKINDIFKYRAVYVPQYSMIEPRVVEVLEKYVAGGGVLIADEGFGMRLENTWMNPYDIKCGKLMKARLVERRAANSTVDIDGFGEVKTYGYISYYQVEGAKTLARFSSGEFKGLPAVQEVSFGAGRVYLLGFPVGFSGGRADDAVTGLVSVVADQFGFKRTKYGRVKEDLEERRLRNGDTEMIFLINSSDAEKRMKISEKVLKTYGKGRVDDGKAVVPAKACLIMKVEK